MIRAGMTLLDIVTAMVRRSRLYPNGSVGSICGCKSAEVIPLRKGEPIIAAVRIDEDHCAHVDDFYAFQERAAIREFEGGLSRQEAEALAADQFPELPSFLDRRRAS